VTIVNSNKTAKTYSLSTLVTDTGATELKDSLKPNTGTGVMAYDFANYPMVVPLDYFHAELTGYLFPIYTILEWSA
jgi:hypothetical protein